MLRDALYNAFFLRDTLDVWSLMSGSLAVVSEHLNNYSLPRDTKQQKTDSASNKSRISLHDQNILRTSEPPKNAMHTACFDVAVPMGCCMVLGVVVMSRRNGSTLARLTRGSDTWATISSKTTRLKV